MQLRYVSTCTVPEDLEGAFNGNPGTFQQVGEALPCSHSIASAHAGRIPYRVGYEHIGKCEQQHVPQAWEVQPAVQPGLPLCTCRQAGWVAGWVLQHSASGPFQAHLAGVLGKADHCPCEGSLMSKDGRLLVGDSG